MLDAKGVFVSIADGREKNGIRMPAWREVLSDQEIMAGDRLRSVDLQDDAVAWRAGPSGVPTIGVPDAVQRVSGAPQSRDLRRHDVRNDPGSAAHRCRAAPRPGNVGALVTSLKFRRIASKTRVYAATPHADACIIAA